MNFNNIVILGGSGDIGKSLIDLYLERPEVEIIYATYFRNKPSVTNERVKWFKVDITQEDDIQIFFKEIKNDSRQVDILISTIGIININGVGPEKSLRDIDMHYLSRIFKVNALFAPLVAKYLRPLLSKTKESKVVFLSALVGSIEENHLGGWYSYRSSKAALNMLVKTIAIEYKRLGLKSTVLSVHPGTTDTKLSRPYSSNVKHRIWTPAETAKNILSVINSVNIENTGSFYHWNKSKISW